MVSTTRDKRIVDPNFPIPDGLELMEYPEEDYLGYESDEEEGADIVSPTLETPDSFSVVEQIAYIGDDGRMVVDVIIEVEDLAGIVQYDVRLANEDEE